MHFQNFYHYASGLISDRYFQTNFRFSLCAFYLPLMLSAGNFRLNKLLRRLILTSLFVDNCHFQLIFSPFFLTLSNLVINSNDTLPFSHLHCLAHAKLQVVLGSNFHQHCGPFIGQKTLNFYQVGLCSTEFLILIKSK